MNNTERLEKLLLMLSSSQDGEVVNAARAIGRALQADGHDWHDLARQLSAPTQTKQAPPHQNNNTDWRAMREYCLQHDGRLRQSESKFLENLGSWRGDLTEKQHAWLVAIYQRLGGTDK
jgi:hypothetical protein